MSKYVGGSVSAKVELDITEFRKTLETLKKDVEILKKGLSNFGTKQTGIEKEVGKLRTEMEKLQRVNKTLSESNKSIKDDSRRIRDEFKKQSESYSMAKEALNKFVSENNKLSESLAKVEKENGRLNRKVDAAVDLWREADHQVRKLSNENDKLSSSMEKLKNENTKLNSELSKTSESLAKAESKYETAAAENKKLADSMNKLKGESKQLKTELANQNNTIAKDTKKVADAQNKEVEVLKKTEVQAKKTGAALRNAFNEDLYNSILNNKGKTKGVLLRPVYDELKNKYKDIVKTKAEFEKLFANGLMSTKTSLYPSRDASKSVKFGSGVWARKFGYINIASMKQPLLEIEGEFLKLETESTNAGKTIESSMNKSSRAAEYFRKKIDTLTPEITKLSSLSGIKPILSTSGWRFTTKPIETVSKSVSQLEKNLNKTATTSKKTTQQIQSNFTQLDKEFTLSLYRNVKQMAENGQVPLSDVMQKLRRQYMSTIIDWETFEKKFLKSMKTIGAEFGRTGAYGDRGTVRFSNTDRGFDILKTDNLKGLREIKAALEGVQTEATQVEKTIENTMNKTASSTKKATNAAKELEKVEEKVNAKSKENNLSNAQNVKKSMDESTKSTERYKKSIVELGQAIKTYNKINPEFTTKWLMKENIFNEQPELNEKWLKQTTDAVHKFLKGFANASIEVKRSAGDIEQSIQQFAQFDPLKEFLTEFAKAPIEVKRSVEEIDNAIRKFAQVDFQFSNKRALEEYLKEWSNAAIQVKRSTEEIETAINKFVNTTRKGYVPIGGDAFKQYSNNWELTSNQIHTATRNFWALERSLKQTEVNVKGFGYIYDAIGESFSTNNVNINAAKNALKLFDGGVEKSKAVLKEYEIQTKKTFETMQVELAKANAAQYKYWKQVRGTADVKGYNNLGTLDVGINQYYGQIDKINAKLAEFKAQQQSVNTNISQTYNEFSKASQGLALLNTQLERYTALINQNSSTQTTLGNRIRTVQAEITSLSNASSKNAIMLTNQGRQAQSLGTRLTNLNNKLKQGKVSNEQYRQELDKLENELKQLQTSLNSVKSTLDSSGRSYSKANAEIKKLAEGYKQAETAGKQSATSIKQSGTAMDKTAHSGRILSNTLYQIRGALLSLKMIATAMGGMALWGFAMEIAEGVKTTFVAKNEMEEQLKANSKVGASGLQVFNRELDNTISKFKKINKYALGETVSAIGLEFELNTKQMSNAMDIVAMLQSEYVRAGRTQEEAALAVKDILQGEFQRLSRETGVGKEELLSYGWSGDVKDIDSILKAVKKAGEDRNWDLFAAKATSLNDVIQITKSRFEEFGADILQTISPAIVSGFNMLVDSLTGLQKAFNGLGTGAKNTLVAGSFLGGITAIATAIPMVTKGMGLADIATIGWRNSLATAALNLNKTTVAQHGFRKALAEVITGTKASDLANVRSSKAIMGRLLGVKQSVLAEHGYMTALVQSRGVLMNHTGATNIAKINSMGLAQKVAYLTNNMKLQKAQSLSTSQAILKTATSWRVLRTAMLGVIGIAAIAWYSSMATWADTVRKNIEGLNEVIDNGDSMLKEAKTDVSNYETALSKLTKGTVEYKKAANNLEVAKANEKDITTANKLAKAYKKQNEQTEKNIATQHKLQMAHSYELAGIDRTKASEMASGWTQRVKAGEQNWIDSMNIYNDRLYKSSQHINEHVKLMKEANLDEKQRLKYIDEYSMKAEEVAENWKKFNQGDMTSGAYAILGELQLQWIDLWNNDHFLNFWNSVKDTWEDLKPTIWAIKDALQELGNVMLDFFSTKHGQLIGGIALAGVALFGLGTKIYHVLGGAKSTIDIFKTLGGKLKDLSGLWKDAGDKAEEANEKMGGGKSTGGIKGEKANSWFNKSQIQGDVQKYTRAAVAIAAGMVLITEAIVLLRMPMAALAEQGWQFKQWEPEIRKGIEGLQLIAPTIMALLPPVIALSYVFAKFDIEASTILKGAGRAAVGIAAGLFLVAEAIALLVLPMGAIAALGWVKETLLGNSVEQGIDAINLMGEAIQSLVPVIPVFVAAAIMGAVAIATDGVGLVAIVGGLALGMLGVAGAIVTLTEPMLAIAALGAIFPDLAGVQRGSEAIKACAEAMTYVEEATRTMALVHWEVLASNIADVIAQLMGHNIGEDLVKLTEEGGFLDQMEKFAQGFNGKSFTAINPDKATALKTMAESLTSLNDALVAAKTAIENVPAEFKNGGSTFAEQYQQNATADGATQDIQSYFDQLKQPIEDLAEFMTWFNGIEIAAPVEGKVEAITSAATMVEQVKGAVDKVKQTMGMVADAGWNQNMASGGIFAAVSGYLGGLMAGTTGGAAGAEGYSSALGSSLKEMENVIKDLVTFNTNVSTILGGAGGDGSAAGSTASTMASMVTAVSDAINQLNSTLSSAVPQIKNSAAGIGTGIRDGIKSGMGNLTDIVLPPFTTAMTTMKNYAGTYGKGVGYQGTQGFKSEFKIKDAVAAELQYALTEMENKKQDFYNKGYALGEAAAKGFKDGDDSHSPGIMARTIFDEIGYIETAMTNAVPTFTNQAYMLGETLASNFNPQLGLGGLSVDDLSQFQTGLDQISYMANSTDMQTSAAFTDMNLTANTSMTGMTTSVNGAFNNIQQNTTTKYGQIVNTTKTSLNNMQSQTTRNIAAIKTSWKGMQNALIASAEHIRSETTSKIHTLQTNMGQFWQKIKNPETLIASAGGHTGTRRRNVPHRLKAPRTPKAPRGYAGGSSPSRKNIGLFKTPTKSNTEPSSNIAEYLKCLLTTGKPCYAGGWDYNWTPKIMNLLKGWNTHFGKYHLDDHLNVGKFENDNFPVRGMADVAKDYIFDVIRGTKYSLYYNSHFGDDPVAALKAGAFNCWDGTNVVLALARAFGFSGSRVHGSWNGTGHVWARIAGIGDIDATAIQQRGTFTAPDAVKGYAGGTLPRRHTDGVNPQMGNSFGDINVNVTIQGNVADAEETGRQIGETASKTVLDILKRSPATGL